MKFSFLLFRNFHFNGNFFTSCQEHGKEKPTRTVKANVVINLREAINLNKPEWSSEGMLVGERARTR